LNQAVLRVRHALGQAATNQAAAQKSAPLYACAMLLLTWKWLDLPGILESECKTNAAQSL
jgi:hypothetical protein